MTKLNLLSYAAEPAQIDELVAQGFELASNDSGDTFFETDRLFELTAGGAVTMPDWFNEIYEEACAEGCDFILLYPN